MKTRDFENKIYDINKKVWHADKLCELDHTRGRNGVRLCCPLLWAQAGAMHEDNIVYKKRVREIYRPIEREVLKNYVKGMGCKKEIYKPCATCAMPQVGDLKK